MLKPKIVEDIKVEGWKPKIKQKSMYGEEAEFEESQHLPNNNTRAMENGRNRTTPISPAMREEPTSKCLLLMWQMLSDDEVAIEHIRKENKISPSSGLHEAHSMDSILGSNKCSEHGRWNKISQEKIESLPKKEGLS